MKIKPTRPKQKLADAIAAFKRAFIEFLSLPTIIIAFFFIFAFLSYSIDNAEIQWLQPTRNFLKRHVFANAKATSDLLGAIAAGIISVTSLTITLLLIVVQQSAASMTAQVFDQFLRRKTNQFYFGYFVGLALYSLITLATVNDPFNPVVGGTLALILTVVALYLLVLLMYTTINQMRPVEIIEAIHNHILHSRREQLKMIQQTRATSQFTGKISTLIRSQKRGYVANINTEKLAVILQNLKEETEVLFHVSIGSYIAFQDVLAEVKSNTDAEMQSIEDAILNLVRLDRQRDIDFDTAYGIEQLETIAWTSVSTAKSNPAPGLLAIRSLRDVLACWSADKDDKKLRTGSIVYTDTTVDQLMTTFETLAVTSSESMQHQVFIEIVHTLTLMFNRVPTYLQQRMEEIVLRILAVMGDLALTIELEKKLSSLISILLSLKKMETAMAVETAMLQLKKSVGKLNSRATRVKIN